MKVIHSPDDPSIKRPVGDLPPGSVIINGEGNLCLVTKSNPDLVAYQNVRMVRLEDGGSYTVKNTCQYEQVDASVTWKRIQR